MNSSDLSERYYLQFAAAYVVGSADALGIAVPSDMHQNAPHEWTVDQMTTLFRLATESGLRLHRFKRTMDLRRVKAVLGIMRNVNPNTILDVGTGRGVFLWPFLNEFPDVEVTAIDTLPHRVRDLATTAAGGIDRLCAVMASATALPFAENEFEIVTMLEVLEHIPDSAKAVREVCRVARDFVIVSVPSKADDNPEHIHLFNQEKLKQLFTDAGATRINFQYVSGHIIAVANLR